MGIYKRFNVGVGLGNRASVFFPGNLESSLLDGIHMRGNTTNNIVNCG